MTNSSINHMNPYRYGYSLLLDNPNGIYNQYIIYPKTKKWQQIADLFTAPLTDYILIFYSIPDYLDFNSNKTQYVFTVDTKVNSFSFVSNNVTSEIITDEIWFSNYWLLIASSGKDTMKMKTCSVIQFTQLDLSIGYDITNIEEFIEVQTNQKILIPTNHEENDNYQIKDYTPEILLTNSPFAPLGFGIKIINSSTQQYTKLLPYWDSLYSDINNGEMYLLKGIPYDSICTHHVNFIESTYQYFNEN